MHNKDYYLGSFETTLNRSINPLIEQAVKSKSKISFLFECLSIIKEAEKESLVILGFMEEVITSMLNHVYGNMTCKLKSTDKDGVRVKPVLFKGGFEYTDPEDSLGESVSTLVDLVFILLSVELLTDEKTLFLDEPAATLSENSWRKFMEWMIEYTNERNIQVIMTTHHEIDSKYFNQDDLVVYLVKQEDGLAKVYKG